MLDDNKMFNASKENLEELYQTYPYNKYADDARILCKHPSAKDRIKEIEEVISKYPDGRIEEFTKECLLREFRSKSFLDQWIYYFFLSYDLMLLYDKAVVYFYEENFSESAKYFYDFVQKVDKNNPQFKLLLRRSYTELLRCYKKLNRKDDYNRVKKEAINLFPEIEKRLLEYYEKYHERGNSESSSPAQK